MTPSPVPHEAVAPVNTAVNTHTQWLRNKGSFNSWQKQEIFLFCTLYTVTLVLKNQGVFLGAKAAKA